MSCSAILARGAILPVCSVLAVDSRLSLGACWSGDARLAVSAVVSCSAILARGASVSRCATASRSASQRRSGDASQARDAAMFLPQWKIAPLLVIDVPHPQLPCRFLIPCIAQFTCSRQALDIIGNAKNRTDRRKFPECHRVFQTFLKWCSPRPTTCLQGKCGEPPMNR